MQESYIEISKYFKVHEFNLYDFLSIVFIGLSVYFIGIYIRNKHRHESYYTKYFMLGLMTKILGGLAYALIYTYYYTYQGDTSGFWINGKNLFMILVEQPHYWWDAFSRNFETSHSFVYSFLKSMNFAKDWEEYRMVQITSLIAPLGFLNFFASSMVLAALCYSGVWRLFLTFRYYFPEIEKQMAISVLFIPTVLLWGSGIMKDTVVFASVGWIVYGVHRLIQNGWRQPNQWVWISLGIFLAGSMKAYVLFSLAPGLLVWRLLKYRDAIKNRFIRNLALPFFLSVALIGGLATIQFIGRFNSQYAIENFIGGAQSMQNWHYQEGANTSEQFGRGSSYTLGDYEPNLRGVLSKVPAAINVTLFRPYLWEADTIMQLLTAFESFIILSMTLYVILSCGPRRVLQTLNKNAFLVMMLSFALIFAFGVGFSAYNFGALARYKVPCMPFYFGSLFVIKYLVKRTTSNSFELSKRRKLQYY